MITEELTQREKDVLQTIKRFIADNVYPPTIRELGEMLNIKSTNTIHVHLNNLVKKGYIAKENKNRSLKLLVPNEYMNELKGRIEFPFIKENTGNLIKEINNPKKYISLPLCLTENKTNLFALQISNQNMSKYGINNQDILIIEKKITANNKDIIVLVTKEKQILVKKCLKLENTIYLEDDTNIPFMIENFIILGKVIGLYRKF